MRIETGTTPRLPFLLVDSADRETPITGATPSVTLSENGATFTAGTGTVTETGNGWYHYTPATGETDTVGFLFFEASSVNSAVWRDVHTVEDNWFDTVVPGSFPSGTAGHALGSLSSGQVTVVSPVSQDGTAIELVRGDDYDADEGRALEFTEVSGAWGSVNLTGATVALVLDNGGTALSYPGSVVTATGNTRKVRVELDRTQTNALKAKPSTFSVVVTQANNHVATLVTGDVTVR